MLIYLGIAVAGFGANWIPNMPVVGVTAIVMTALGGGAADTIDVSAAAGSFFGPAMGE
jgi:hypothetical protein